MLICTNKVYKKRMNEKVIIMTQVSKSTKLILEKLGFINSNKLYFKEDINDCKDLSPYQKKVLNELNPVAFFCVNNRPFILFFEEVNNPKKMRLLSQKIWNAQIPVVIFNNDTDIIIYNGSVLDEDEILESIEKFSISECDENSNFSYWNVTDKNFWIKLDNKGSNKNLNQIMLENLEYVTKKLKNKYNVDFATKLILRLIFIRCLIDRGIDIGYKGLTSDIIESRENLLKIVEDSTELYKLFYHLKERFNGNLFDVDDEEKETELSNEVFITLKEFLSGELEQDSGQFSMFPLYDFNIIPVELISNIYEILLGEDKQKKDKSFYTPPYLVDFILAENIEKFVVNNKTFKVLDPSCGSGIFLVGSFRKMLDINCSNNEYLSNDNLNKLLVDNIYGIDKNAEAIDVAIFSLYLTILDYTDLKKLNYYRFPNLLGTNLIVADFFDDEKISILKKNKYDFILGNPPWGLVRDNKGELSKYRKKHNYLQSNNEISKDFIIRSAEFLGYSTVCCLIVTSKILYNSKKAAIEFRKMILKNFEVVSIVELSSVRELLFKNVVGPATIITFKKANSNPLENNIKYVSLKPNVFFKLFNIIVREKNDTKLVKQQMLLEYDWLWKTLVYGTIYDFEIIRYLKDKYSTINDVIKEKGLICGSGIEDNLGDKKSSEHLLDRVIIDSNEVSSFSIGFKNASIFNKREIHRPRRPKLFEPPYCLIRTGANVNNYKMRAAYSEESFIYKKVIYGVKGNEKDKDTLKNLVGLLNSSFYSYLNLMLGSSIGIWMEIVIFTEVFGFPYLENKLLIKKVDEIQEYIEKSNSNIEFCQYNDVDSLDKLIEELDMLVLEMFELENNNFVDYAINVQIPELTNTNKKQMVKLTTEQSMIGYAAIFQEYWTKVLEPLGFKSKVKIYHNVKNSYNIFEMEFVENVNNTTEDDIQFIKEPGKLKEIFTRFMLHEINDIFYDIKDVINFEDSSFFIIKTNEYKNWHPAIAEIDLVATIDAILFESEEI